MPYLTLPTHHSTPTCQSCFGQVRFGLSGSGELSLFEGWQRFGAARVAGSDTSLWQVNVDGSGPQGIDQFEGIDQFDRFGAALDTDLDAVDRAMGVRSPLPTTQFPSEFQTRFRFGFDFGFFSIALAALGHLGAQLHLSGRCRLSLSPI
ncbi:MAG: hypothetical protein D6742_11255 [Cyanobacteria bacterium J069]|nr:MAG: hypothetical protein D6742_11255 [Cyanobacteria bacterium J069]